MSDISVKAIELPRDSDAFIRAWWPIYAGDEHWVPPLIGERKAFFNPAKNPYFKVADVQCFMAYKGTEAVGTIAATVDHYQQKTDPNVGLFGFFEFIDDPEVARSLFEAACDWLREKGMERAWGPFNFNSNHEFGLLVDGFDTDPCIANPHNHAYYVALYEGLGLKKVTDWYAYWLEAGPVPPRIERIANRVLDRHPEITLEQANLKNFNAEVEKFWEIYNDAWEHNWGHIFLSKEEFLFAAQGLKAVLDERLVWWAYVDGNLAGAALTLPDYNQVAKKMNGKLFPFGWFHFLMGRRKIDQLRVFVLGVKKDYQRLGLGAPLYMRTWEECIKKNIRGAEASLVLESNRTMRGALEKLGGTVYKTYRSYEYKLTDSSEPAASNN